MDPELAAQCAIDRAEELIEDIADNQSEEGDRPAPPSRGKPGTKGKVLPLGRREWIVDSGSSFDILSPYDLSKTDEKNVYSLSDAVGMNTADGQVTAEKGLMKRVFKNTEKIECLLLPNSPSLLSLGRLCLEAGYRFEWPSGQNPWLTYPSGESIQLDVSNRVPVLPMLESGSATVCPSYEGGATGSECAPGEPVPEPAKESPSSEEANEADEPLLEGDLPPDHYTST